MKTIAHISFHPTIYTSIAEPPYFSEFNGHGRDDRASFLGFVSSSNGQGSCTDDYC